MTRYDGVVHPGGPAATRMLTDLTITKVAVGAMDNNVYLLRCRASGEQLLIDAAADSARLFTLVGAAGLGGIVTTHRHDDHVGALSDLVSLTHARTYAHEADADALPVPVDVRLHDGDIVQVGDVSLIAVHLAGHTPGGLALVYDDPVDCAHAFVGDSLFPGGVGNTWGDAEAFHTLLTDVHAKLFDRWPDDTRIYPGHGADTTLGAERPALAEWASRGW